MDLVRSLYRHFTAVLNPFGLIRSCQTALPSVPSQLSASPKVEFLYLRAQNELLQVPSGLPKRTPSWYSFVLSRGSYVYRPATSKARPDLLTLHFGQVSEGTGQHLPALPELNRIKQAMGSPNQPTFNTQRAL